MKEKGIQMNNAVVVSLTPQNSFLMGKLFDLYNCLSNM
jgi:hypothetical protein